MPEPSDGAGRPLQVKERAWVVCTSRTARLLALHYGDPSALCYPDSSERVES
jgi:hypothetical protein